MDARVMWKFLDLILRFQWERRRVCYDPWISASLLCHMTLFFQWYILTWDHMFHKAKWGQLQDRDFPDEITLHSFGITSGSDWASLEVQLVKKPPAVQETWVRSLGWEDSLEKGTATHSSILAWRIPWTVESTGLQRVGHATFTFTFPGSD